MTKSKTNLPSAESEYASSANIESFLATARRMPSPSAARLVFALDATMSRQPSWDVAADVQAGMFDAAAALGGLSVQLAYFRGTDECQASRWVADPASLRGLMQRISCRGGETQIVRILDHVRTEAGRSPVRALVYVGDAMEEPIDALCARAGELGLLGVKAFMFHEGRDPAAEGAFREVARLTRGAYLPFDSGAPAGLAALLKAIVAYASGGAAALQRLASRDADAHRLILAMAAPR